MLGISRLVRVICIGTAVVALAAALSGCSKVPAGALTEDDSGGVVEMAVGESFQVALEANMTTGYGWYVTDGDAEVVFESEETSYESDTSMAGSAGIQTSTFEAVAVGETVLVLGYLRPWEEDVEPLDVWSVTVRVE